MEIRPDLPVWILAGQSNMQGCGWLRGHLDPNPRVLVFSSAGEWEQAREPLHRLWESFLPVHEELSRPNMSPADRALSNAELAARDAAGFVGAGLGLAFGIAMADTFDAKVGLIPAAHGGTTLDQWSPDLKGRGGHSLYGAMLERAHRAGGTLQGILWYQGESDACSVQAGTTYAARLDRWIAEARADLGIPNLPVIAVQVGRVLPGKSTRAEFPSWDIVREAIRALPQRVSNTAVTTAVDLPMADSIHVSTAGLIRLGRRLARLAQVLALQGLERGEDALAPGPDVVEIVPWVTPDGNASALRVRFSGVGEGWQVEDAIRGFAMHAAEGSSEEAPFVINAWVDDAAGDDSVIVQLSRPPRPGEKLSYAFGTDPLADLVDGTDMPLCAFMPREIPAAAMAGGVGD